LYYAQARNAAKAEIRKAVRDYERIAKQAKRNPKAFYKKDYKYVNSKLKTRSSVADLRTDDEKVISCDTEKANVFNEFFSSVYTVEDVVNMPAKLEVLYNSS